jgi:hypothetical protein
MGQEASTAPAASAAALATAAADLDARAGDVEVHEQLPREDGVVPDEVEGTEQDVGAHRHR